jgi:hypothetical protein
VPDDHGAVQSCVLDGCGDRRGHILGIAPRQQGRAVEDVTEVWDAVCMGLAMREICGAIQRSEGARIWTATLQALVTGLGSTDQARPSLTDQQLRPAGSARGS